jgi:predicted MFS family arabinose efflux permease
MSIARRYALMLCLGLIGGFADAMVFNLPFAVIGSRVDVSRQRRAIGTAFASLNAAPILGIPILTFVGSIAGWRVALALAGVVSLLAAFVTRWALPTDERTPDASLRPGDLVRSYRPVWHDRALMRVLIATMFRSVCWPGALTYSGAYLDTQLGLGTRTIGLTFTVLGLGSVLASVVGGRNHRVPAALFGMIAAVGLAVGVAVAFAGQSAAIAIPAFLLASFSATLGNVTGGSLAMERAHAGSGTTMVLNGTMLNFGAAFGIAIGGLLLHIYGYAGIAFGMPIFAVISGFLLWVVYAGETAEPVSTAESG